jgi:hypothetical protein
MRRPGGVSWPADGEGDDEDRGPLSGSPRKRARPYTV